MSGFVKVSIALAFGVLIAAQGRDVRVYVSVMDQSGTPIIREAPEVFVWENDEPRTVTRAVPAEAPPAIVVIVHGIPERDTINVRVALSDLVEALQRSRSDTRIALVTSVTTTRLENIETAMPALGASIRRFVTVGPRLLLFEAIDDACRALALERTDRRIVFVMSGGPDAERESASVRLAALRNAGVSLWVIEIQPELGTPPQGATASRQDETIVRLNFEMEELFAKGPALSGGLRDVVRGSARLPDAAVRMARVIGAQIGVTFTHESGQSEGNLRIGVAGRPGDRVVGPAWSGGR